MGKQGNLFLWNVLIRNCLCVLFSKKAGNSQALGCIFYIAISEYIWTV